MEKVEVLLDISVRNWIVPEKANALITSLGKEVKHDCTLAQIYNSEDNGAEELKRNKIGF